MITVFDETQRRHAPSQFIVSGKPQPIPGRGRGAGVGFNLNLPLERGAALSAYARALDAALERIGEFAPNVLVVAAGLDIAIDDPFRGFAITTADFAAIGTAIAAMGKPMPVVQEGGYPSQSLGTNLASLLGGLAA